MLKSVEALRPGGRCCHRLASLAAPAVSRSINRRTPLHVRALIARGSEECGGHGTVFTFGRWAMHRDAQHRYQRHIANLLTSRTWLNLTPPLTGLTVVAGIQCLYQELVVRDLLPGYFPLLQMSDGPFELTSFALSLLLVFRTDSSYGRWLEAMNTWSTVKDVSKDIVRMVSCWVEDPKARAFLLRWTIAFSKCLKVSVREKGDYAAELNGVLLPAERAKLASSTSPGPTQFALAVLSSAVTRSVDSEVRADKLLSAIARLGSAISACDKLLKYPIPLAYTRHTSRFMIIWLCFLPLSLWDDCGWGVLPIEALVSFLLLGIEEIGVQIEEPFRRLPLDDLCADIERDIGALAGSRDQVEGLVDAALGPAPAGSSEHASSPGSHSSAHGHSNGVHSSLLHRRPATLDLEVAGMMEASSSTDLSTTVPDIAIASPDSTRAGISMMGRNKSA
uniref:Bestrophin homolog n=1 Tax=Chlamydomonas leiostraca TaxID=1034604 RepID=A0A7S0S479_9CHLO|mmetsp:Transcript_684/g.1812  ORF Transcript_684/g.1812 Transcript_684/m.1812 type:complete len:449 (+) Transcript_684:79-1425(+)